MRLQGHPSPLSVTLLALLFTAISFTLLGCSSSDEEPAEPKEIPLSEKPAMEGSEADLFVTAKRLYSTGYYLIARDAFQSIIDSYPMGPYAEFSEIKLADSLFIGREYAEAAIQYENFLKTYPSSQSAPYVTMRAGISFKMVNTDLGRDRQPLEKAMAHFDTFLQEYPDSMYRSDVIIHRAIIQERLADHEKMIADFYQAQGKTEAYERRQLSYELALAEIDMDQPRAIDLAAVDPAAADPATAESIAVDQVDLSDLPSLQNANSSLTAPGGALISPFRAVTCTARAGRKVTIELQEPLRFVQGIESLTPDDDQIVVQLPLTAQAPYTADCFEEGALKFDTEGQLSLRLLNAESDWKLLELNNPPRLLLVESDS